VTEYLECLGPYLPSATLTFSTYLPLICIHATSHAYLRTSVGSASLAHFVYKLSFTFHTYLLVLHTAAISCISLTVHSVNVGFVNRPR
jgi:hypothetical protein